MKNYSVFVSGTIVSDLEFSHEMHGESFYMFSVRSERKNGGFDVLPVMVKESMPGFSGLSEGDYVCVKGYINTRRTFEGNVAKTQTYINAYEVVPATGNVNRVDLFGYVCGKQPVRELPSGRKFARVTLAVPRYKGVSDYVQCVCWGENAEKVQDYEMGRSLLVRGRMQSRPFGKDRVAYEVSLKEVRPTKVKEEAKEEE